jgi:acetate kinase
VRVLTVNAGSSSLKLRLVGDGDELLAARDIASPDSRADDGEVRRALAAMPAPDVVGHRIVHGGTRFRRAVRVEPETLRALAELTALAPLHQPKSLAALDAVTEVLPGVPAVACFDTAFHATLPLPAATYAIPADWRERWGVRRYGFHGLSHAYAARRAGASRVVTCHLGAGASLAAVRDGRSVDTTMGFTPLEGLVMATRSGSIDPGLLLWLLERTDTSEAEMARALEHESGLLALAGSADMREVIAGAERGEERACLAFDVYVHRLRAGIASMAAAMDGLDALVFTGGVGENAPAVRAAAARGLGFLGVALDEERNAQAAPDVDVSSTGAAVRTLVVTAREDLEIAAQTRATLASAAKG